MLRRLLTIGTLALLTSPFALAGNLWLHVHVDEGGDGGERVRVNLPMSVIEQVLPLIKNEHIQNGRISVAEYSDQNVDLAALWAAVRDADDGEFVTVQNSSENVRVAKSEGMMLVRVDGNEKGSARVRVTIPLAVVDALMKAGENEFDLVAAISELKSFRGDLVTVEEADSRVRIWIDDRQEGAQ